jgi:hypothetical protein
MYRTMGMVVLLIPGINSTRSFTTFNRENSTATEEAQQWNCNKKKKKQIHEASLN